MKFVVGENRRNPVKNLPRPHFVHHETRMEGPRRELGTPAVRGERLTACATRPPTGEVKPRKTSPVNLSRPGIEPGPAARQGRLFHSGGPLSLLLAFRIEIF